MRFDLWLPAANPFATPEFLLEVCRESEAHNVNRIWLGEHVVLFDDYASSYPYSANGKLPAPAETGLLDPLITLGFVAAHTYSVRLGTAMCLLPQRNPLYTAKEVATLDWLSGGRIDLGVGVGWLKEEFEALGVPWAQRGRRTDEYIGVLRSLWEEDPSTFDGELVTLPKCRMHPKPIQRPVPIHVGGESDAALRRVARFANGWVPFNCRPAQLATLVPRLEELLAEQGRSRTDIEITVCPYFEAILPGQLTEYVEAGADAFASFFLAFAPEDVAGAFEALAPLMDMAASV
jgi:probable F420-dependent oxidoreductase